MVGGATLAVQAAQSKGIQITVNGNSYCMAVLSSSVRFTEQILERQGIRGTRSHNVLDTRRGPGMVAGSISLEPSPSELALLCTLAIGNSGNTSEVLPYFTLGQDEVTQTHWFANCKAGRLTIRGTEGAPLTVTLDVVGKSEAYNSTPIDTAASNTSVNPFIFSDCALAINTATTREVKDFTLVVDNHLITNRYMNSLTLTDIPEADRTVSLQTQHAYASNNSDLYNALQAGMAGTLTISGNTAGGLAVNASTTFTFGSLQAPAHGPELPRKTDEIMLTLDMTSRKTGNTAEISSVSV